MSKCCTHPRSGLVIDSEHDWLACNPDDLAHDGSPAADEHGLVEYVSLLCQGYQCGGGLQEGLHSICDGWSGCAHQHYQVQCNMPKK